MQGTVKWFDPDKGYGFISPDGGGKDAFVHIKVVERAGAQVLNPGQKVSFDIVTSPKSGRPEAGNLQIMR